MVFILLVLAAMAVYGGGDAGGIALFLDWLRCWFSLGWVCW